MTMKNRIYKALVVEEAGNNVFTKQVKDAEVYALPAGEVIVQVMYSSLNYKDALSATGNKGVTRNYPHTPGIDAAGIVVDSATDEVEEGEQVIVTGYDLGMNTAGGFGQYIRVPADWVVKLPPGLSMRESMIFGTAGFTAGMSVDRIIDVVKPGDGEILVTGATGGVGSIAVAILSKLGYAAVAVSGKEDATAFLTNLGAREIISRKELTEGSDRPLLQGRWAGVVDTVGGNILATAIKSTRPLGLVTCCGHVASPELFLTVFPFILRGVTLAGIDSQNCPMALRTRIWKRLAAEWKIAALDEIYKEVALAALPGEIEKILKGQQKGRVVVNLDL
jgi:putative YhdH/YhfP family quinone oxidoreductase